MATALLILTVLVALLIIGSVFYAVFVFLDFIADVFLRGPWDRKPR